MRIGYYAHHHGSGHCRQADKFAAWLVALGSGSDNSDNNDDVLTVFTSTTKEDYSFSHLAGDQVVRLPPEDERSDEVLPGRVGEYWQPSSMHYSPVGNVDIQSRSLTLLQQIATRQIKLMIIDLSVEVALLCRAASIPYLYVRLPGERDDMPHRNAFQGALGLLAAYPECLEAPSTPTWIKQKTLYLGFVADPLVSKSKRTKEDLIKQISLHFLSSSRHKLALNNSDLVDSSDDRISHAADFSNDSEVNSTLIKKLKHRAPIVTVIKGFGGHAQIDAQLALLRQIMPGAFIISLGPIASAVKGFVDIAVQVDEVMPYLQLSDLLVMSCGLNAISEACQVTTPLVVIPDTRPHREQEMMAEGLIACGRAISFEDLLTHFNNDRCSTAPATTIASADKTVLTTNTATNPTTNTDTLAFERLAVPSAKLQAQLNQSISDEFISSLAKADNARIWFYSWLLPRLRLSPERPVTQ